MTISFYKAFYSSLRSSEEKAFRNKLKNKVVYVSNKLVCFHPMKLKLAYSGMSFAAEKSADDINILAAAKQAGISISIIEGCFGVSYKKGFFKDHYTPS